MHAELLLLRGRCKELEGELQRADQPECSSKAAPAEGEPSLCAKRMSCKVLAGTPHPTVSTVCSSYVVGLKCLPCTSGMKSELLPLADNHNEAGPV